MPLEQHHQEWTLYSSDRNLHFHLWPHLEPQHTIAPLLAEIDDHANGAFWGQPAQPGLRDSKRRTSAKLNSC